MSCIQPSSEASEGDSGGEDWLVQMSGAQPDGQCVCLC